MLEIICQEQQQKATPNALPVLNGGESTPHEGAVALWKGATPVQVTVDADTILRIL
jgi:hypothetical protein